MRRLLFLFPIAIAAALFITFWWGLGRNASLQPSALIDQPIPQFTLPPVGGVDRPGLRTSDLKGEVALVNFFASWCVPCLAEHPLITRLAKDGLPVYGINYKNKPEEAAAWLSRYGNPYARIGSDIDGRAGIEFGVTGMPESFIVDRAGVIRYKQVGPITSAKLKNVILPLIVQLQLDVGRRSP